MGSFCSPSQQTSSSAPPQWLQNQMQNVDTQAFNVAQANPYRPYEGQLTAGVNGLQQQAMYGLTGVAGASIPYVQAGSGQSFSGYNTAAGASPYYQSAANTINGAQPYYQQGANAIAGAQPYFGQAASYAAQAAGNVNPVPYLSPYEQNVIDTTMRNVQRNDAIAQNGALGTAIQSGNAFGGDRMGVANAELARNQSLARDQTMAGLQNQDWSQALQTALAQHGYEAQAAGTLGNLGNSQIQAGNAYGNLGNSQVSAGNAMAGIGNSVVNQGNTLSGIGVQQAGIGGQYQNNALAAYNSQLQGGNSQYAIDQAALNAQYQQYQNAQAYPYQQTSWLSGIVNGTNAGGTTTTPGASPLSSTIGTGLATVGALGAAGGSAGLAGSLGAIGAFLNRGGRVGYADGGVVDNGPTNTIPEMAETLQAQQQQLLAGNRDAQMFPNGTPELPVPDGMARTDAPSGAFHYNPNSLSPSDIQQASKMGRENDILDLGPFSKDDILQRIQAGEPPIAIVERNPQGVEVRAALGTTGTLPIQLQPMQAKKSPQNTIQVEDLSKVLSQRQQGNAPQGFAGGGAADGLVDVSSIPIGRGVSIPAPAMPRNANGIIGIDGSQSMDAGNPAQAVSILNTPDSSLDPLTSFSDLGNAAFSSAGVGDGGTYSSGGLVPGFALGGTPDINNLIPLRGGTPGLRPGQQGLIPNIAQPGRGGVPIPQRSPAPQQQSIADQVKAAIGPLKSINDSLKGNGGTPGTAIPGAEGPTSFGGSAGPVPLADAISANPQMAAMQSFGSPIYRRGGMVRGYDDGGVVPSFDDRLQPALEAITDGTWDQQGRGLESIHAPRGAVPTPRARPIGALATDDSPVDPNAVRVQGVYAANEPPMTEARAASNFNGDDGVATPASRAIASRGLPSPITRGSSAPAPGDEPEQALAYDRKQPVSLAPPSGGVAGPENPTNNPYLRPPTAIAPPSEGAAKPDIWQALMAAGLGIMSSNSPNTFVNIGKGGQAGIANFAEQRKAAMEEYNADARAKQLADQAAMERARLWETTRSNLKSEETTAADKAEARALKPLVWDPKTKSYVPNTALLDFEKKKIDLLKEDEAAMKPLIYNEETKQWEPNQKLLDFEQQKRDAVESGKPIQMPVDKFGTLKNFIWDRGQRRFVPINTETGRPEYDQPTPVSGPSSSAAPSTAPAATPNPSLPSRADNATLQPVRVASLDGAIPASFLPVDEKGEIKATPNSLLPGEKALDEGAPAPKGINPAVLESPDFKDVAGQIKGISEGRMPYPSEKLLQTPQGRRLKEGLAQYDSTFDATNFKQRQQLRNSFLGAGADGKAIRSVNQLMQHVEEHEKAIRELSEFRTTGYPGVSAEQGNAMKDQFYKRHWDPNVRERYQKAVAEYEKTGAAVASELGKVAQGGVGTLAVDARREWQKGLDANASPVTQMAAVIASINLLKGGIDSLGSKWNAGMGPASQRDPLSWLSPQARHSFEELYGADAVKRYHDINTKGATPAAAPAASAPTAPERRTQNGWIYEKQPDGGWKAVGKAN